MTFKQYLFFMSLGTFAAVAAWVVVLQSINPVLAGVSGRLMFYITLFVALVGTFALVGTMIRVLVVHKKAIVSREVARAFRHSILFSSIIILNLLMASVEYMKWWTVLLTVLFVAFIELFFLTAKRGRVM